MHKMISCDNPSSVGMRYVGVISYLIIIPNRNFLFDNMYSSTIKVINKCDCNTTITTKNTTYVFEEVQNEES